MSQTNVTVVGIVGPSGSGKSSLASRLGHAVESAGFSTAIIREDDFYKDRPDLSDTERAAQNYDHPDAFDRDTLRLALESLRQRRETMVPEYDYARHRRSTTQKTISPADIVIAEGILLLHSEQIRDLCCVTSYVDTAHDICLLRRIRRDTMERGRSVESVLSQYESTVRPMLHQFVQPQRAVARLVLDRSDDSALKTLSNSVLATLSTK